MVSVQHSTACWLSKHILPHESALRAHLRRWGLPHDLDVDDVVQEAYGVLAGSETLTDIRDPRSYLFGVARSIVLKHVRRARIVPIIPIDPKAPDLVAEDPSPETLASDRQQLHLLALAIASLPDPGGRIFRMRKIEGCSYQEIGARLGLSDNAVQKSMSRTMRRLISALGRGGNVSPRDPRERYGITERASDG